MQNGARVEVLFASALRLELGGIVNVVLLLLVIAVGAYLVYAMLKPEDF